MFGFLGNLVAAVRDFFAASWAYLKRSNATFNSLGDDLITRAKNDLLNLKAKLDKLWDIQEQDKETTALYVSAVLGKIGFTFIIIGISLIASLLKLTGGVFCLFLAGRWLTLASNVFNIFSEIFSYGLTWLKSSLKKFGTYALELCSKIVRNLGDYAERFLKASLDFLSALTSYLNGAWHIALDFVAATGRALGKVMNAIGRFVRNVIRNFSSVIINCFKGVGHIVLGTLRATTIVVKGVVLSVAALFIETGIANSLSGLAKTAFILDESLAASIGSLMDGVYASGSSFTQAAKSIFGYGVTTSIQLPPNEVVSDAIDADEVASEASVEHVIYPSLDDSAYFSRKARDNMHYVNEYFASAGNELLRVYQEQRDHVIGATGWSDAEIRENVRSNSTPRPF